MLHWVRSRFITDITFIRRMWTVRLSLLVAIASGVWVALPAFQYVLPPLWFAGACIVMSLAICVARLTKQKGFPDA